MIAQVGGAIVAAMLLPMSLPRRAGLGHRSSGLAANGYGAASPGRYSMGVGFVTELVMTFMFLMIILGATSKRAPAGFAPIAIGLKLTLIHLISIPVTNTW